MPSKIDKILIANRGEIALRVIRTARAMGIRTVAVYSDADRDSAHVAAADEAVRIGPAPAAESYLDIAALLKAAAVTGADAVHPGYGFLSERAAFAAACAEAGLAFIGPTAEVIEAMGRKDAARLIAEQADVPVLPVYQTAEHQMTEHQATGDQTTGRQPAVGEPAEPIRDWPVLVKAAAGGGGKGMRIVRAPEELAEALVSARREAESAFGDGTLLVERFVEHGRHIEVQILADTHGTVLHLGERDCSVQRRHQKVVEETPAPTISPELRTRLLTAAVRLAGKVGYTNAGTVEFLVAGEEFFFLEMNTRLQVEHSVTEAVTGLDLVEWQIRIARGEKLPFGDENLSVHGHAIEVRVYAEDPDHGFLPQAGRAAMVTWPAAARVDTALSGFGEVTAWYDPMIAKITVHGADRAAARLALRRALDETRIDGLTTNLAFLRRLAASAEFTGAAIDTGWLDTHPDHPFHPALDPDGPTPFDRLDGWRLGAPPLPARADAGRRGAAKAEAATDGTVRAPMPGTVIAVKVQEGQQVAAGEVLGVLEAMKMEHTLTAPWDGSVTAVGATVGDQIPLGHPVFRIDPAGGRAAGPEEARKA
jgi:acetyl-CoA/propionyl-CoA carboxylase, biotin carboxylase, biotin carboxyl carrier protein